MGLGVTIRFLMLYFCPRSLSFHSLTIFTKTFLSSACHSHHRTETFHPSYSCPSGHWHWSGIKVVLVDLSTMSTTLDVLDLDILGDRFYSVFIIQDTTLYWFQSCLCGRSQTIFIDPRFFQTFQVLKGVCQGIVLGLVLCTPYTLELSLVIERPDSTISPL